jgi:uncharacterized protein (DUF1800 family)
LARRTGFGATGRDIDAIVAQGASAYLRSIVAADPTRDPGALTTPPPDVQRIPGVGKAADKRAREARNAEIRAQLGQLVTWWLRRMVTVQNPFGEKLTFLWHNHFATSATKVRQAGLLLAQNQRLRTLGRGDFRSLAYTMLTDAAMLYWLDGESNSAAAPNENLSREFMELFALGHGDGYTETDVRQGARALTGWAIDYTTGSTYLEPARFDDGTKTFLGVTGDLDAAGYCDAVLSRPASGPFVCGRMYGQLVSDDPPSATVLQTISGGYGPGRSLSGMLTAMLSAEDFTAKMSTTVVSPVEWMVGVVRTLRVPVDGPAGEKVVATMSSTLNQLGQLPFYPPNVGGWPAGQAWLSTSAAEIRMRAAAALMRQADIEVVRSASAATRLEVVAHLLGIAGWSDRTASVLKQNVSNPAHLVTVAFNTPEYLTN